MEKEIRDIAERIFEVGRSRDAASLDMEKFQKAKDKFEELIKELELLYQTQ